MCIDRSKTKTSLKNKIGMFLLSDWTVPLMWHHLSSLYLLVPARCPPRATQVALAVYQEDWGKQDLQIFELSIFLLYFWALQSMSPCRVSSPTRPEIIPGSWLIGSRLRQRVEWCFLQCNGIVMLMSCCINPVVFSTPFQSIIIEQQSKCIRVWYLRTPGLETFVKFCVPWIWYCNIWSW